MNKSPSLRISRGNVEAVYVPSSPILLLGAGDECDIPLPGRGFPEVALRLLADGEGFRVMAVAPGFAFQLDGKNVTEGLLRAGSRLEIGDNVLAVDEQHSPGAAEPSQVPGSRSEKVLAELSRLYRMVGSEGNLQSVLTEALQGLQSLLGGSDAFVFTLDSAGHPSLFVTLSSGKGEKELFSDSVVQEALRSGKTVRLENALADPRFSAAKSVLSLKLRSVLCSPIQMAGKIRGLFYLGSNLPALSYGEEDQRVCELYATLAGTLIHHLAYISQQRSIIKTLTASEGLEIVASCPPMLRLLEEARAVADTNLNILLLGESGTGKDVLAHFLHRKSRRKDHPFLVINCGTLRGEMLASELFGHKRGAFTGAVSDSRGLFPAAHQGTLLLDEIGELELPLQAALLRVIETGRVRPLGQAHEEAADVRVLCATNRNLEEMVRKGQFREDLYFRINQHSLRLPPLRDRGEDLFLLAHHFLEKAKGQYPEKGVLDFHPDTMIRMRQYAWPGNIRELVNAVAKGVVLARTPLVEIEFSEQQEAWIPMAEATRHFQREYAEKAVAACGGDKEKAAALLRVGRSTLFNYLSGERVP